MFAVLSGTPRKLLAYDLSQGSHAWTVDADVQSRVVVGRDFVAAIEGSDLVVRSQLSGERRVQRLRALAIAALGPAADDDLEPSRRHRWLAYGPAAGATT